MTGARGIGLVLFAIWAVWLVAVQALATGTRGLGPYVPDLGLVLALSLVARGRPEDVAPLALLFALARASFAVDPPFAILAGAAGVLVLARAMRSVVETHGPLLRTLVAGACALLFDAWLIAVHHVRHEALWSPGGTGGIGGTGGSVAEALLAAWPAAASTALAALVLGPTLARLPGLTPLRRGRW